ncbi:MAG: substrate-binding domain-containing protein [Lachnospiraceae bacterium]|nr:substrate-binding domain-containing protein [Lachnospiraceae bacterium]
MKKLLILLLVSALILSGCSMNRTSADDGPVYALVTKAQGNTYNEMMAQGFQEVIEQAGGNCLIYNPQETTAEEQIQILQSLVSQGVDSITVAANDADALTDVLQSAMKQGIVVSSVDSDVNVESRQIFVNQAAAETIARALAEAVYEICGGEGQWAILSATSQATNQNAWIRAMRSVLEEEKYQNLRLVDIVYGDDDEEISREMTQKLLEEYPDLKVICAPTVIGLEAVAQVLTEHPELETKATGLGLPSVMAEYIEGENPVCPCMFLWNPVDLGRLAAYVSLALVNGELTGIAGEEFEAGDMGVFQVEEDESGALQVVLAWPLKFDTANIGEWKSIF